MKKTIQVKYSFAEDAEIVDRNSQEIQEYMKVFKTEVIPEMEEIERRKTRAIEHAYKIRVCSTDFAGLRRLKYERKNPCNPCNLWIRLVWIKR